VEEEPSKRLALRKGLASEASMWLWAAEVGRRIRGGRTTGGGERSTGELT
jgi:hypothetical protein